MEDFKIYSIRTVFKRLNSIQIRFYQMEFTRSAIKVNKLSCTLYTYVDFTFSFFQFTTVVYLL